MKLKRSSSSDSGQVDHRVIVTFFLVFMWGLVITMTVNIIKSLLSHFAQSKIACYVTAIFASGVVEAMKEKANKFL